MRPTPFIPSIRFDLVPATLPSSVDSLGDEALLRMLFGQSARDVGDVVERLLEFAGGLHGLANLSPEVVAQQAGIGRARAARLQAAFELGRRRWTARHADYRIDSLEAVVAWARPRLLPLDHEEVWLLCLNGRNSMRSCRRVAQGGLHGCAVTAKDILRPALRDGASAIVLVHNHPSGDPTPSDADVTMTADLDVACATVGLPLLDHVVVAAEGAASLMELGAIHSP